MAGPSSFTVGCVAAGARAAARNLSLSSYLRDLIHDDASRPLMEEVLQRIASRVSVETGSDAVRSFIDDGRR